MRKDQEAATRPRATGARVKVAGHSRHWGLVDLL